MAKAKAAAEAAPAPLDREEPLVVAVFNQKGGVGKTTTSVNVAATAASPPFNRKVLLVDFDPQAHATFHSGVDRAGDDESSAVHRVLIEKGPDSSLEALAIATPFYDVLRGGADIQDADMFLSSKQITAQQAGKTFNAAWVFAKRVAQITPRRWDLIVIDCPPDLSVITLNALHAATGVVIPLHFEYASLVGMADISGSIERAQNVNPRLQVAAVLGIRPELRTMHGQAMQKAAREAYPEAFVEFPIRKCIQLAEALGNRQPITHYGPRTTGAKDYFKLTDLLAKKGAI